jgi:putative DNA primase/helicase
MPMTNFLTAASIIGALGGNSATGMCRCPAHDDKNPSLHVADGSRGVVVKCHAGCSQERVIGALKARGLWTGAQRSARKKGADYLRAEQEAHEEFEKFRLALGILRTAARANAGKPQEYLKGRGIEIVPPCARVLP